MTGENKCRGNSHFNNSTKLCDCNDGFFRADCSHKCDPGTYGFACGNKCSSCSVDDCNHVYGCPQIVSTTLSRIPSSSTEIEASSDTENTSVVVISIVSVAATLIVVGLVLLCCFRILREKKKRSRNGTNEDASGVFLMPGVDRYAESNNSDNLYTEPNLYESDVTSARDNDSPVDSTKFETRVNGTPEVDEDHYNHITLKIDMNPKYARDDTDLGDMYSHIKTTHPPSRVLTDNHYSHVTSDSSP